MKTVFMLFPILFAVLFQWSAFSCKRQKPEKKPDVKAQVEPDPAPASGEPDKTAGGGHSEDTLFYIQVNFRVLRRMAMVQANVSNFREMAKKQGILGHLITCGVDPFLNAHELVAVIPPKIRQNPGGSVTVRGDFDETKVIACLEREFVRNRHQVVEEGGFKWLRGPLFSFQLLSPGKGIVTGITRNWKTSYFPDELITRGEQLPTGHVLLLGATGEVFPVRMGMQYLLLSFAPDGDHLRISGALRFLNESMAKMLHGTLISGIDKRRKTASASPDPNQQLLLSLLGRLDFSHDREEIRIEARIPNTELAAAPGLFRLQVKGNF